MDSAPTNDPVAVAPTPSLPAKQSILPALMLSLLLIVHLVFVLHYSQPAITSPDANGYWAQGTTLYQTGHTWFKQESDVQYVGMHWLLTDDGRYFSRYPPGLAVLIAGAYWIDGARAAVWFDPLTATLALLGLFLLCRKFMSGWASFAAVLFLAINPIFNLHAQYHYAHMAVMALLLWGLLCLVRWARDGSLRDIFLAGVLLGAIPTIRYPEAIFALGIATYILWTLKSQPRRWAPLLAAGAGVAIPIIPLLIYDQFAFGAPWKTAYVLTNEQSGFGWSYFKEHFVGYIRSLNGDGAGPLFALGILGMGWMCVSKEHRRFGVLLALIAVPSTLLYMAYYWGMGLTGGNGTNMRYLLPTFACYVLGGVWFLAEMLRDKPLALRGATFGLLLLCQFCWGGWWSLPEFHRLEHQKNVLALAADKLSQVAQRGDIVMADSQVLQHLDYLHQWRLADNGLLSGRGGGPGGGRFMNNPDRDPNEPSPQQSKKWKLFQEKYGEMQPAEREVALSSALKTWAGSGKVYFVGAEAELDELGETDFCPTRFKILQRIPLPQFPEDEMGGPGGRGGPGGWGGMRRGGRNGGGGWRGPGRGNRNGGNFGPPPGMPPPGPGGPGGFGPPGGPGGFGGPPGWGPRMATEYVIAEWLGPAEPTQLTHESKDTFDQ